MRPETGEKAVTVEDSDIDSIYAISIWAGVINKSTYRIRIETSYRRSALMVISAFRTVSTDATVAIARMMPLGLVWM